jgi:hypothetical protein
MQHAARNSSSDSAIYSTDYSTSHASGNSSGTPSLSVADARTVGAPRQKSLVAFLRAIQFRDRDEGCQDRLKGGGEAGPVGTYFAQLKPRARQRSALAEEACLVRSAN